MTTTTKPITTLTKAQIIDQLRKFINQRSGINFADYQTGDYKASREAFLGDYRPMLKAGKDARLLLRQVEIRESITADDITRATEAFSGRLQFKDDQLEYCTGQYFPTEYRAAVCTVLARVFWTYWREKCMPAPVYKHHGSAQERPMQTVALYDKLSAGDWLRRQARREFGRSIANAWFN